MTPDIILHEFLHSAAFAVLSFILLGVLSLFFKAESSGDFSRTTDVPTRNEDSPCA